MEVLLKTFQLVISIGLAVAAKECLSYDEDNLFTDLAYTSGQKICAFSSENYTFQNCSVYSPLFESSSPTVPENITCVAGQSSSVFIDTGSDQVEACWRACILHSEFVCSSFTVQPLSGDSMQCFLTSCIGPLLTSETPDYYTTAYSTGELGDSYDDQSNKIHTGYTYTNRTSSNTTLQAFFFQNSEECYTEYIEYNASSPAPTYSPTSVPTSEAPSAAPTHREYFHDSLSTHTIITMVYTCLGVITMAIVLVYACCKRKHPYHSVGDKGSPDNKVESVNSAGSRIIF